MFTVEAEIKIHEFIRTLSTVVACMHERVNNPVEEQCHPEVAHFQSSTPNHWMAGVAQKVRLELFFHPPVIKNTSDSGK